MPESSAVRGPYIQIAERLRIQRGAGRPDLVSERPTRRNPKGDRVAYLDDPATNPTLVEFDEHCQVNIDFLLRTGGLRPYTAPPAPPAGPVGTTERPRAPRRQPSRKGA